MEWSLIFNCNIVKCGYNLFELYEGINNRIYCALLGSGFDGQYEFYDGHLERLPYDKKTGVCYSRAGGGSLNNVLLFGQICNKPSFYGELYHYDGFNTSYEGFQDYWTWNMYARKINYKFEKYYLSLIDRFSFRLYLIKGIKKLKN